MEKVGLVRREGGGMVRLPPGFRFHPTDEELVEQYLRRKVLCCPLPAYIIPEIDLSRYDPWDLPGAGVGLGFSEKERYFFNWRAAKYRNGNRSNRAGGSGYWKATGKDRPVMSSRANLVVGMKKVLVFYRGKPPHGSRTDWIMHEYRLAGAGAAHPCILQQRKQLLTLNPAKQMEDWVLCRIFQKKRATRDDDPADVDNPLETHPCKRGVILIDFMRQHEDNTSPPRLDSESSCVTELSGELSSDEEVSCNSTSSYLR